MVDFSVFTPCFKLWHTTLTDEHMLAYTGIFRVIQSDADDSTRDGLKRNLNELVLGNKLAEILAEFEAGSCSDILQAVSTAVDTFKLEVGIRAQAEVTDDIWDIMQDSIHDGGLHWRLSCLNEHMRPLVGGDFGVVAGRPDGGKTTFLASEASFMAPQLADTQNVVWLNNEGKGQRIKYRIWQSTTGLTQPEMVAAGRDNLMKWYIHKLGRLDRIRVFDIHGFNTGQVEAIMEANNVGLAIWDMVDHIKGFNNEARDDRRLEEMYMWARERCVKFNCIGIAASQISNEGDNVMYPTLGMLKDSKTGKQGASDFQLMIGRISDPGFVNSRFIGLPKNKLRRTGTTGDPRQEVRYDPDHARYSDLPQGV